MEMRFGLYDDVNMASLPHAIAMMGSTFMVGFVVAGVVVAENMYCNCTYFWRIQRSPRLWGSLRSLHEVEKLISLGHRLRRDSTNASFILEADSTCCDFCCRASPCYYAICCPSLRLSGMPLPRHLPYQRRIEFRKYQRFRVRQDIYSNGTTQPLRRTW